MGLACSLSCGDEPAEDAGRVAHAGAYEVRQAQTVCAAGATVPGIDVSYYQGDIDWGAVAAAGYKFAIARHSDGYFHDPKFQQNWDGIRNAGMIRGVYQWFEPNQDPVRQADELIAAIGVLQAGDLPVMADVEEPGPNVPSPSVYAARLRTWVDRVKAGTGRDPMIYTGHWYWPQYLGGTTAFNTLPLVHAQYTSAACPNIADAWSNWVIWQYSSTGSVPGIAGNVDMNRFNGTMADLAALAGGGTDPQCAANPSYGGCAGTVITWCVNGRVSSGDCGAYGAGCSTEGGTPHCVHPYCIMHGAGENAEWCDAAVMKKCAQGVYSEGNCGAYGAACSVLGGTAHCVHPSCGTHGENSSWCDGAVIKTCAAGAYSEGNCGAFGATCSELGGSAHCVHPYCAGHGENASWCTGNLIKTCTAGAYAEGDCAYYGAACSELGGTGHCVHPYCILHGEGENAAWCDGTVAKTCALGVYAETPCTGAGVACTVSGGTATCASPSVDAGTVTRDAGGVVPADGGWGATDGGGPAADGGGRADGGTTDAAAVVTEDGGGAASTVPSGTVGDNGGARALSCGCATTTPAGAGTGLLLLVVAARRRRHAG